MVDIGMIGCWRLAVREQFCAAHALRNYHGKCENLHGHNFAIEVKVEGEELDPATGMLIDFGVLKSGLRDILKKLDHCHLNTLESFSRINPSSENLARHIAQEMTDFLNNCPDPQARKVRVVSVEVAEKSSQSAQWIPD